MSVCIVLLACVMELTYSSDKKEAAPVAPLRSAAKGEATASGKASKAFALATAEAEDQEAQHDHHHPKLHKPNLKQLRRNCKQYCAIISYVILGVLGILVSVGVIAVTSIGSVAVKIYDPEQSSRLVAMIVLAVAAAISLSMTIYAIIGTFRNHTKPIYTANVVLIILSIMQALIIGIAINVTSKDEMAIGKSLQESFRLAKEDNARHVKIWAATQFDLHCCGVFSPEDYRDRAMPYYFPPNVPISCCPTYDETKAPYSQERNKEICKVNGTYFDNGCRGLVVEVFKETSVAVVGVNIVLIIFEILLTLTGAYLNRRTKVAAQREEESEPPIHKQMN